MRYRVLAEDVWTVRGKKRLRVCRSAKGNLLNSAWRDSALGAEAPEC